MALEVYATNVTYADGYVMNQRPFKHWDDLEALKGKDNPAYCVKTGSIATRNGTYNRPAPIQLKDFNININQGTKIKKVIVHYSQQKFSLSRSQGSSTFPVFGGATFTLLGTGKSKVGEAVSSKYTGYTLEFTDITREQLVSSDFGLKIDYPRNNSTNTGRMCLGNVFLEIITEEPQIVLDISTENNNIVIDDNINIVCSVEHINSSVYDPVIDITVPDGLTLNSSSGHGELDDGTVNTTEKTTVYKWTSKFDNRTKNSITLNLTATSTGTKTIGIADTLTSLNKELKVNIEGYSYTVETSLNKQNTPVIQEKQYKYYVKVSTNKTASSTPTVKITLPPNTTIVTTANNDYNVSTANNKKVVTINKAVSKDAPISVNLTVVFNDIGYNSQDVTINNKSYLVTNFLVQAKSYRSLGFTRLLIPADYTDSMGDGIQYTLRTVAKHIVKNNNINLHDWNNNLRVGIYNSTVDDIVDEDDFLSHVIWCSSITSLKWAEYTCNFKYDSSNPLYIVYSHDYLGNPLYYDISLDFSQPFLVETQYLNEYRENKLYPVPISALLNNTDFAIVNMEKQTDTAPVLVYDWSGITAFNTEDISIRGITLKLKYVVSETVELQVKLGADGDNKIKGYRNKTLQKGSGTLTLGGKFDLFGLRPHDFRNKVKDLTVELVVNNPYDTKATVELSDVNITFNYIVIEPSKYGFEINGERSEEYGIYFYDMEPALGTNNEIDEYHITGTDKSIVNRMNIKPKEIDIDLAIDECELQDELEIAEDVISKLFTNKRNILTNKPTEKYIIFDYLPNNKYWFVRKAQIKDKIDKGTYYMTVTLYIPSGTAEIVPKVISGSSNATNGLISIEPQINLLVTKNGGVSVTEKYTGQSLLIVDSSIKIGDTININNEKRQVTRKPKGATTTTDITSKVDFSTTWFKVRGEYLFESPNSIITDVQYYERR